MAKQVLRYGEIKADDASMKLAASRAVLAASERKRFAEVPNWYVRQRRLQYCDPEAADGLMSIAKVQVYSTSLL